MKFISNTDDSSRLRYFNAITFEEVPEGDGYNFQRYEPRSFVPDFNQQYLLDSSFEKRLSVSLDCHISNTIAIFEIDPEVVEEAKDILKKHLSKFKNNIHLFFNKTTTPNLYKFLYNKSEDGKFEILGVNIKKPQLHTSTFDPGKDRFLGLHLDGWDKKSFLDRKFARNRLAINIGEQDRHFLFVPIEYYKIEEQYMPTAKFKSEFYSSPHDLPRHYMQLEKPQVVCVTIKPGEAYLAPTENLIHDATTFFNKCEDISLQILGQFPVERFITNHYFKELY